MNKLRLILLGTLLAPSFLCLSAFAQGNILYNWHGNSGYFQASFQVTPEENQPGGFFESSTFLNSILIISPDATFTYRWPGGIAGGRIYPPMTVSILLKEELLHRKVSAFATRSNYAVISEDDESDPANTVQIYVEPGYWTSTSMPIPEPSCAALLAIFGFARLYLNRRLQSKALPLAP